MCKIEFVSIFSAIERFMNAANDPQKILLRRASAELHSALDNYSEVNARCSYLERAYSLIEQAQAV